MIAIVVFVLVQMYDFNAIDFCVLVLSCSSENSLTHLDYVVAIISVGGCKKMSYLLLSYELYCYGILRRYWCKCASCLSVIT